MTSIQHPLDSSVQQSQDVDAEKAEQKKKWHQRIARLFSREDSSLNRSRLPSASLPADGSGNFDTTEKPRTSSRLARQVIPRLPRPGTFRRQLSERRERLSPSELGHLERRTLSVDGRREFPMRTISAAAYKGPRTSAPAVYDIPDWTDSMSSPSISPPGLPQQPNMDSVMVQRPTGPPTPPPDELPNVTDNLDRQGANATSIQAELESRWILNLSMHFRDKSPREKFFVTYAETPTRWRRVTVSCDYRNAPPDSLESDLRHLQYQRDKSARIYEAIRSSLPDIQFYDTVTNLRLETSGDERLHVHVTEDVNEIIPYPDKNLLSHIDFKDLKRVSESEVHFVSHMSGFVYKVKVDDNVLIKKEIPGPDSVEEFLYEINALNALRGSQHVVQIRGLVLDESRTVVTGLLIDYYEQGPLVDVLFDYRDTLSWERRVKWATQIIQGLGEIHEAGYVQGDFTVSNICVTKEDDARIIDINRRGCPVGWEPPEIARMIDSGQRISMYIGVKSDLFQLGMVLWALAMEDDEPERRHRPLRLPDDPSLQIPDWYRELAHLCLDPDPRKRPSASRLLTMARQPSSLSLARTRRASSVALSQQILPHGDDTAHMYAANSIRQTAAGATGRYERRSFQSRARSPSNSSSLSDEGPRGRSPPRNIAHLDGPRSQDHPATQGLPDEDSLPIEPEIVSIDPTGPEWQEVVHNGEAYIVHVDVPSPPPASDTDFTRPETPLPEREVESERISHTHPYPSPQAGPFLRDDRPENDFHLPPAPDVPQVTAQSNLHPSFHHIDSGLADMHLSPIDVPLSAGHYWRKNVFDRASDNGSPSLFMHQDSGLGEMDLDVTAGAGMNEELVKLGPKTSSGRRTWAMETKDLVTGSSVNMELVADDHPIQEDDGVEKSGEVVSKGHASEHSTEGELGGKVDQSNITKDNIQAPATAASIVNDEGQRRETPAKIHEAYESDDIQHRIHDMNEVNSSI